MAQRSKIVWMFCQTVFWGSEALTRDKMPCKWEGEGGGWGSVSVAGNRGQQVKVSRTRAHTDPARHTVGNKSRHPTAMPRAHLLLVVAEKRLGLVVVHGQALLEQLGVVVRALDERLASDVVLAGHLGRVELGVVGAARGLVDQAGEGGWRRGIGG